jgi:hypothetical protein
VFEAGRSMADFFWFMTAAKCGWSIKENVDKLLETAQMLTRTECLSACQSDWQG